jgi:hypothetical protein
MSAMTGTEMLAALAGKQTAKQREAASDNRAWAQANMPEFARLFDNLRDAGMAPRMVKLERFA